MSRSVGAVNDSEANGNSATVPSRSLGAQGITRSAWSSHPWDVTFGHSVTEKEVIVNAARAKALISVDLVEPLDE